MLDQWHIICNEGFCTKHGHGFRLTIEEAQRHFRSYHPEVGEAALCILCEPAKQIPTEKLAKHLSKSHADVVGGSTKTAIAKYKELLAERGVQRLSSFDERKNPPPSLLNIIAAQATLLANLQAVELVPNSQPVQEISFLEKFTGLRW